MYPEYFLINKKLISKRASIYKCFDTFLVENRNDSPFPKQLKSLLDIEFGKIKAVAKKNTTFLEYLNTIITTSESGVRVQPKSGKPISANTIKTYKTTQLHLTEFSKAKNLQLTFDNINLEFYDLYKTYLMKQLQLSNNTIGKHFQIIKLVMNEAIDQGLTNNTTFKSKRFFVIRETSDSVSLNENEIEEIQKLDLYKSHNLDVTRDLFVIGCMTGLRYSDLSNLKSENLQNGKLFIKQIKTGDRIVVPINKAIERILQKNNGHIPKAYSNQKTNQYLKEICKKVPLLDADVEKTITKGGKSQNTTLKKWELVTTHTARRSFATNEVKKGTPVSIIMAITGHVTEKSF